MADCRELTCHNRARSRGDCGVSALHRPPRLSRSTTPVLGSPPANGYGHIGRTSMSEPKAVTMRACSAMQEHGIRGQVSTHQTW